MKSVINRLNNIVGQIEGIKKMIVANQNCLLTLNQLKATKSAISSVMNTIIEQQLAHCIKSLNRDDQQLLIKLKTYVQSN